MASSGSGLQRQRDPAGRVLQAWTELSSPATLSGHGWQSPVDCAHASELCAAEAVCSSSYRTLRQCLAGRDHNTLLGNKDCQAALEVLQGSALHGCRCRRRMKKELSCLQTYWSLHRGSAGGEEFYEASPYEPISSPLSDAFRLASIVSAGTDSAVASRSNPCLDAAKACNLNDNCKKFRSAYISTCNKHVSATEHCSRHKCHKALRHFFDRVPSAYSYRLLFCSCKDQACAERRRQTIVPDCSYQEREKPNCLALRSRCRAEPFCRSRLADFHANCQAFTSCSRGNYQACLDAYAGLIGLDLTPNYVDASFSSPMVSLWCSCRGSGNMEEECEKFLKDFTENACLRNAIQAFGNGSDLTFFPKAVPPPLPTLPPSAGKASSLPYNVNDSSLGDNTGVSTTCASAEESGAKINQSKEQSLCFSEKSLTTALVPEQKTFVDTRGSGSQLSFTGTVSALLFFLVKMTI
ncbi:GDNF family receptor alpha-2 isoform X2 [Crotalus tigris]|uniref:GDNF family receptor alpha-2 isoform X2 n=1 Tax=Crotalus tigris TaxID=88082 RepID=UPI00192F380A|nr:GDNF family receptor alpha-2 isoform X2 [Crotalus tigris]